MDVVEFKKGERVDEITTAGEDFCQYSKYGITADIFTNSQFCICPIVKSDDPGSGKFQQFLHDLKQVVPQRLVFTNVINGGLLKYLCNEEIPVMKENGKIYKLQWKAR